MSIVEFLMARIAEDEAAARAAMVGLVDYRSQFRAPEVDDGRWEAGDCPHYESRVEGIGITIYDEGGHTADQAKHIARHDPARVLRQCEAMRRIVGLQPSHTQSCGVYHPGHDAYHPEGHLNEVLTALATIWVDHPDYDPAWGDQ